MLPIGTSCFHCQGAFKPARLKKGLPPAYGLFINSSVTFTGMMLDTFDGDLRRAGKVLLQLKSRIVLVDLNAGTTLEQGVSVEWKFAEQLKGGAVGFQLLELSRLRAFLPVCEVVLEQQKINILDELQKTVARSTFTMLGKGSKKAIWVTTESLRGYDEEHGLLSKALKFAGFESVPPDYYSALGIKLELYESKPDVALDAKAPIVESAGNIVGTFLDVARKNELGIQADLDSEFIHDYRVSLRRIRSLLSLFRGVYSEEENSRLKTELAEIMKQTNRLRDLDVYLLDRDSYYKLVPPSMHAGLDIMFDVFVRERQESHEQICTIFQGAEYGKKMTGLQKCFQGVDTPENGTAADEPTLHFARRLILKRYKKVSNIALALNADTPDETVHELRIQCKKLRYLMEFFTPLFSAKEVKPLVKSLKVLQDVLGRFNDYSVQRESLAAFVSQHPMRGKKGLKLAESVGALVATLYQLQLKARGEVGNCIEGFVNEQTRSRFVRLFSNKD